MYTITRVTPDGITKSATRETLRDAGKHVAYCLSDNANASKQEATRAGMELEKTGRVESHGYTFTLEK